MAKKDLYVELCKSSEFLLPKQDRSTILEALRQTIPMEDLRVYFLLSFGQSLPLAKLYKKAAQLKMTEQDVDEALERLYKEFFVLRYHQPDGIHYERCPLTMLAEQQVRAKKGTAVGKLYADYWLYLATNTVKVIPTRTPYFRVLPVEAAVGVGANAVEVPLDVEVPDPRQVLPLDIASEVVRKQRVIGVAECYCRAMKDFQGEHCEKPRETCFVFNEFAESLIDQGIARVLTLDEALQILRECEQNGLVHNADNFQGQIRGLCNCCSCCCPGIQAGASGQKNVQADSRYVVQYDPQKCLHDYACVEACPFDAISYNGPVFNSQACFGCGHCVSVCPGGALHLEVRTKAPTVPRTSKELNNRLMREAVVGLAINKLTGRKAG
jgi:Fe-S-cluster-containing hydrogenase component 2